MANEDLLVEVGLSESQYRAALARMEAQTVKSAKKQEKTFKAANTNIVSSFDRANKGANVFASHGLRNVSMQLSQVAQQGQVTGNYLQALAIQLPDIGLAFGTIGIAAGVAAGAILPVVANMVEVGGSADEAAKAIDDYVAAVGAIRSAVDTASASIEDLTKKYGENAEAAREAAVLQAKLALAAAERDAQGALSVVEEELRSIASQIEYVERLENAWRTAIRQQAEGVATSEQQMVAYEAYLGAVEDLEGSTGRTLEQNRELSRILGDMADEMASGTLSDEFRAAAERALEIVSAAGDLDAEIEEALKQAIQLELSEAELNRLMDLLAGSASNVAANIAVATGEAIRLGDALARAAQSQAAAGQSTASIIQDYIDNPTFERGEKPSTGPKSAPNDIDFGLPSATSGGGSSGSGGGGGINEDLREAQRLFDETRTDAENYAAEVERIQELHAKGLLDEETFTRALDMVAEEYDQAAQAADAFAEVSGMFGDAIIDAAMGGTEAMEDLAKAIQRAVLQAALLGEGPLAGLFSGLGTGGLLGNITSGLNIPSFDGGGYTGSGARSGGIDGRGGQLAVLHPNETVIDHTKGGGMGSSIVYSPTIDARGASEEAVAKLAAVIAEDRRNFSRNVQGVLKTSGLRGR